MYLPHTCYEHFKSSIHIRRHPLGSLLHDPIHILGHLNEAGRRVVCATLPDAAKRHDSGQHLAAILLDHQTSALGAAAHIELHIGGAEEMVDDAAQMRVHTFAGFVRHDALRPGLKVARNRSKVGHIAEGRNRAGLSFARQTFALLGQ